MGTQHITKKLISNFRGVNKRISNLVATDGYASDILNATYLDDGSISKRKGFSYRSDEALGKGATAFVNENFLTAEEKIENIYVGKNLHKKIERKVEILFAGGMDKPLGSAYITSRVEDDGYKWIRAYESVKNAQGLWTQNPTINLNLYTGVAGQPNASAAKLELGGISAFTITDANNSNFIAQDFSKYYLNNSNYTGAMAFHNPISSLNITNITGYIYLERSNTKQINLTGHNSNVAQRILIRTGESFGEVLNTANTTQQLMPIFDEDDVSICNSSSIYLWDSYNEERVNVNYSSTVGLIGGVAVEGKVRYHTIKFSTAQKSTKYREFELETPLPITSIENTSQISFTDYEPVSCNHTTAFPSFDRVNSPHTGKDYLENASFASSLGSLYIASYDNFLMKYDGHRLYRAGLISPKSIEITSANSTGPAYTNTWFKATFEFMDAKGNLIESAPTKAIKATTTGGANVRVNLPIDTNTDGDFSYNNDIRQFCVPSAVQKTQTTTGEIIVYGGAANTLVVGDIITVGAVTSKIVEIIRDYTSSPTITDRIYVEKDVSGETINANGVLNLSSFKVNIYASGTGGQEHGLYRKVNCTNLTTDTSSKHILNTANLRVTDVTPYTAIQTFEDFFVNQEFTTTNGAQDDKFNTLPEYKEIYDDDGHGLPPKAKYIASHQNCLILGGIQNTNDGEFLDNANQIVWTPNDQPEYFPLWNYTTIPGDVGDYIRGIRGLRDLFYVFQGNKIQALAGDFGSGSLRNITLSTAGDIGCVANSSITEIGGSLLFLDEKGIYSVNSANPPKEVSSPINVEFKNILGTHLFKHAVGYDWSKESKFLVTIPKTRPTLNSNTGEIGNIDTTTFVFEYFRNAWTIWDNFDITGGVSEDQNLDLFFIPVTADDVNNNISTYTCCINNDNSTFDYVDHDKAITFIYKTNWEHLNNPSLFKRFLRLKVHSTEALQYDNAGFNLKIEAEKDFVDEPIAFANLDFKEKLNGFGEGEFGQDIYGAFPWLARVTKLPQNKAKSYRINFNNNVLNEGVLISGYELEIAASYKPELKE